MASRKRGALYIGVTNNPMRRIWEHKKGHGSEHVRRYKIDRLVWLREFSTPHEAIEYEKDLKKWRRDWKIELIEESNPDWNDLFETIQN